MSSHHIVREKQEPALLIASLKNFPDELLGQLLEWSPTVIVTAETAESVQTYGIKIDWLVAAAELPELTQADVKIIHAGNQNPVIATLNYLTQQGYPAVNIITNELHLANFTAFVKQLDVIIFYQDKKVVAARSGFSKWKPAGERIEILTLPHNFQYTGLIAESDTVFKTVQDGFYTLQFTDDYLWLAEAL